MIFDLQAIEPLWYQVTFEKVEKSKLLSSPSIVSDSTSKVYSKNVIHAFKYNLVESFQRSTEKPFSGQKID